jgi:hypothetical protein
VHQTRTSGIDDSMQNSNYKREIYENKTVSRQVMFSNYKYLQPAKLKTNDGWFQGES